jgi:hypothetical protein
MDGLGGWVGDIFATLSSDKASPLYPDDLPQASAAEELSPFNSCPKKGNK